MMTSAPTARPPRLIDLHTDWILQYAPETSLYNAEMAEFALKALPQAEGYLGATAAAVLAVYRDVEDWTRRPDPWAALSELITRIEAEFSGRLLIGPDDLTRWRDDPDGLTWGIIGVEGFDLLIRSEPDLERLPALFDRGVRVFQPVYSSSGLLGGSASSGDARGLTDLGRGFLDTVLAMSDEARRPALDLAHMNPATAADVLDWFERDVGRADRIRLMYSHGALTHAGFATPRACTIENLGRLRALGGTIGLSPAPPFYDTAEAFRRGIEAAAAIPFRGRAGYEGIAIGTDFLGVERTIDGLGNAGSVISWVSETFASDAARSILHDNGARLLESCVAND